MLQSKMAEALSMGLRRKTLTTCSRWAQQFVHMGDTFKGPMTFKYHPWTKEMHDSEAPKNVGQKSAQMGYTVACLNRALYTIDQLRLSVLYLLPSKTPDATNFSSGKFDPALEMSPHLAELFSDVKNAGMKRAGSAILYINGSNSRKGLKSLSVSRVFCDEYDEMPPHTVPMASERMSGQLSKQLWLISTPRFPGKGINAEYLESTQEHFMFKCPKCSKQIELLHRNLVITADDIHDPKINESYVKCHECDNYLFGGVEHNTDDEKDKWKYAELKGEMLNTGLWVPHGHKDFSVRGFYINQLYSPTIQPVELAKTYIRAQTNKSAEQEYHNSKMGDAHEVDGARITLDDIQQCVSKHGRIKGPNYDYRLVTMGVDVGKWLHIEICGWYLEHLSNNLNHSARAIQLWEGKKVDFSELDDLMRYFRIHQAVVDVQPETRQALNFAKRFDGYVKLCRYGKNATDKSTMAEDSDSYIISVDRTSWLDTSLGRFRNQTIDLPRDLSGEYQQHVRNIARIYEEDSDGNQIGKYISNGDDHFAHARNYCEIALPYAAAITTNSDIRRFL